MFEYWSWLSLERKAWAAWFQGKRAFDVRASACATRARALSRTSFRARKTPYTWVRGKCSSGPWVISNQFSYLFGEKYQFWRIFGTSWDFRPITVLGQDAVQHSVCWNSAKFCFEWKGKSIFMYWGFLIWLEKEVGQAFFFLVNSMFMLIVFFVNLWNSPQN